jgi:hypothetical protein
MGLFLSSSRFWFVAGSLFGAGKPFFSECGCGEDVLFYASDGLKSQGAPQISPMSCGKVIAALPSYAAGQKAVVAGLENNLLRCRGPLTISSLLIRGPGRNAGTDPVRSRPNDLQTKS